MQTFEFDKLAVLGDNGHSELRNSKGIKKKPLSQVGAFGSSEPKCICLYANRVRKASKNLLASSTRKVQITSWHLLQAHTLTTDTAGGQFVSNRN